MRKIGIFGCGGSIGTQALEFIKSNSANFKADVLVTYSNVDLLVSQAKQFGATKVGLVNESEYSANSFSELNDVKVAVGKDTYELFDDVDTVLFCAVGASVLPALWRLIERVKRIALANKECLVAAGELIMAKAKQCGTEIIPVDSEHSAVWQCLRSGKVSDVKRIILTASGGRYYRRGLDELDGITPSEAVKHPNWKMGKKISVDSATMMNKALELIEARWLFDTKEVDYVVHPDSVIHSLVEFNDGAIVAQLSEPDMRLPISIALAYPDRTSSGIKRFEFDRPLNFLQKNEQVFFAPSLARYCIEKGGTSGAILDASNEAAVKLFMQGDVKFTQICSIAREELYAAKIEEIKSIYDVIELHNETRERVLAKYRD